MTSANYDLSSEPGNPKIEIEGKAFRASASWKRALDGKFIESRYMLVNAKGEPTVMGIWMAGMDPSDKKTKSWGYESTGGHTTATLTECDGRRFVWKAVSANADNVEEESTITFELLDEKNYRWEILYDDGTKNGAHFVRVRKWKTPSWPEPAAQAPDTASDRLKAVAYLIGDHVMEGTDAFTVKTVAGQSKCGWTLAGSFLRYETATIDDDLVCGRYMAILGLDPPTKVITGWEFDNTGTVGKYTVADNGNDLEGKRFAWQCGARRIKSRE